MELVFMTSSSFILHFDLPIKEKQANRKTRLDVARYLFLSNKFELSLSDGRQEKYFQS